MKKVKLLSVESFGGSCCGSDNELEANINNFVAKGNINVIDIKYSTSLSYNNYNSKSLRSALIIYEVV